MIDANTENKFWHLGLNFVLFMICSVFLGTSCQEKSGSKINQRYQLEYVNIKDNNGFAFIEITNNIKSGFSKKLVEELESIASQGEIQAKASEGIEGQPSSAGERIITLELRNLKSDNLVFITLHLNHEKRIILANIPLKKWENIEKLIAVLIQKYPTKKLPSQSKQPQDKNGGVEILDLDLPPFD